MSSLDEFLYFLSVREKCMMHHGFNAQLAISPLVEAAFNTYRHARDQTLVPREKACALELYKAISESDISTSKIRQYRAALATVVVSRGQAQVLHEFDENTKPFINGARLPSDIQAKFALWTMNVLIKILQSVSNLFEKLKIAEFVWCECLAVPGFRGKAYYINEIHESIDHVRRAYLVEAPAVYLSMFLSAVPAVTVKAVQRSLHKVIYNVLHAKAPDQRAEELIKALVSTWATHEQVLRRELTAKPDQWAELEYSRDVWVDCCKVEGFAREHDELVLLQSVLEKRQEAHEQVTGLVEDFSAAFRASLVASFDLLVNLREYKHALQSIVGPEPVAALENELHREFHGDSPPADFNKARTVIADRFDLAYCSRPFSANVWQELDLIQQLWAACSRLPGFKGKPDYSDRLAYISTRLIDIEEDASHNGTQCHRALARSFRKTKRFLQDTRTYARIFAGRLPQQTQELVLQRLFAKIRAAEDENEVNVEYRKEDIIQALLSTWKLHLGARQNLSAVAQSLPKARDEGQPARVWRWQID
ncbi:hypothetical protein OIO90_004248 [Microbotryomycetes sp. JL221]|nr:hypothetical protein OIO90_004248 [Microbotryomycetes sp. JL221]